MGRQDEIVKERVKKLDELRAQKIEPYPSKSDVKNISSDLQNKYSHLKATEKTKDQVKVAGRIMIIRDMGKIAFASLQDGHGKIQVILQEDETPEKTRQFFKKYIDEG